MHFWMRSYIRAAYAMIEGVVYGMKQAALAEAYNHKVQLSPAETSLLLEEDYDLKSNGEPRVHKAKLNTTSNIRFAFAMLTKAYGINFQLQVEDNRWDNLQKGLKVRDRLMHPKSVNDLTVTDEERRLVLTGTTWFFENFQMCFKESLRVLEERRQHG